jgi:uncharacterized membrane protein YfcA
VLTGPWLYVIASGSALLVGTLATPAGVSGAVLLLPFQVAVLGTPSPAVTPTNLLYNVIATPGAIYRYWRQGQMGGKLTQLLITGTVPGVVVGSIIRVDLLPGDRAFEVVIATFLVPLGIWLLVGPAPLPGHPPGRAREISSPVLVTIAAVVGCVGGLYGVGGGSILAPILISSNRAPAEVAPATLASTFITSVAGVLTFVLLAAEQHRPSAPNWGVGIALGAGGLLGGYLGARLQPHLPERVIRRTLGLFVIAIGIRYGWVAVLG